jgi:hypothetical protein
LLIAKLGVSRTAQELAEAVPNDFLVILNDPENFPNER